MRHLICLTCKDEFVKNYEKEDGWNVRITTGVVKKSTEHFMTILGSGKEERIDIPVLVCDHCNAKLEDGTKAATLHMYRSGQLCDPNPWEQDFIATPETVQILDH